MEQPSFSKHETMQLKRSMRKRAGVFLIVILSILAVMTTVGSLRPGVSTIPTSAASDININELLFADDFNDDQNGWLPDIDAEAYFDNGELHLICRTPGGSKPLWFFTPSEFDNLAFQVEATKIDGPNQQYGLIFGKDGGELYLFGITESGFYGLMRWTGEEWVRILDYTQSPHINQADGTNTLTVFFKDSRVELQVNGQYLETVVVDYSMADSLGLYVAAEGMHVSFDNVRVYSLR